MTSDTLTKRIERAIEREKLNLPMKASGVTIHVLEDCLAALQPSPEQTEPSATHSEMLRAGMSEGDGR